MCTRLIMTEEDSNIAYGLADKGGSMYCDAMEDAWITSDWGDYQIMVALTRQSSAHKRCNHELT